MKVSVKVNKTKFMRYFLLVSFIVCFITIVRIAYELAVKESYETVVLVSNLILAYSLLVINFLLLMWWWDQREN